MKSLDAVEALALIFRNQKDIAGAPSPSFITHTPPWATAAVSRS